MHTSDPRVSQRLVAMTPTRYSWTTCALTRNVLKHSPEIMQDLLRETARMHMTSEDETTFAERTGKNDARISVSRNFPLTHLGGSSTYISRSNVRRVQGGGKSYCASTGLPPTDIQLHTLIEAPSWSLDQAILTISGLPLTTIESIIGDTLPLSQIVDTPYLDGFSIHSIHWNGEIHFRAGGWIRDTAAILTSEASSTVEIKFSNTNDYKPIAMP